MLADEKLNTEQLRDAMWRFQERTGLSVTAFCAQ